MHRRSSMSGWPTTGAVILLASLWGPLAPVSAQAQANDDGNDVVAARVSELLAVLTESGAQSQAPVFALESLEADERLPLSVRERTLHELALQLRERPPSAAGQRALLWLSSYESQVMVQHEGRGPATVPKWRVAGVARGTLALWARRATGSRIQRQLETGALDLDDEAARAEAAQDGDALAQVLRFASREQLVGYRERLLGQMKRSDALAPAAAEVALQLQDADLCRAVLASNDRRTAIQLIADIGEMMPPEEAFPILRTASADDDLASAATVAIGTTATQVPAARDFLLEALADPLRGGSAAKALADMEDVEMVYAVAANLEATDDPNLQAKAVLMLALDGSSEARESLRDFARRPDAPAHLRREIKQWLRGDSQ